MKRLWLILPLLFVFSCEDKENGEEKIPHELDGTWVYDQIQCDLFRPDIDTSPVGQWGLGVSWNGILSWELEHTKNNEGIFTYYVDSNSSSFTAKGEWTANGSKLTFNYLSLDSNINNPANDWIEMMNIPNVGEKEIWDYEIIEAKPGSYIGNTSTGGILISISKDWESEQGTYTLYGYLKKLSSN